MRSVRSESGDTGRDDEASTSAWIIAALVALAILLILLVLAVGVGVWMSKGKGTFGDQPSIFTGLLRSRFRDGRFSPGLGDFQHGEDREGDGEQSQGHGIGRHVIKIDITLIDMQGRGLRQQQDIAGHD